MAKKKYRIFIQYKKKVNPVALVKEIKAAGITTALELAKQKANKMGEGHRCVMIAEIGSQNNAE